MHFVLRQLMKEALERRTVAQGLTPPQQRWTLLIWQTLPWQKGLYNILIKMLRQDPLLRQLMISAVQQSLEEEGNLLTPPPYRLSSSLLYLSIFLSLLFWLNQNNFLMTKTNTTKGRTRSYDNCVKEGRSQKVQLLDSTLQNTPRFLENIICLVWSLWNYV